LTVSGGHPVTPHVCAGRRRRAVAQRRRDARQGRFV